MKKKEILEMITEETHWGLKKIKEDYIIELHEQAKNEGTEWGEDLCPVIECYNEINYVPDELMIAMYNYLSKAYVYMYENTELIEYPERSEIVLRPAKKSREWID